MTAVDLSCDVRQLGDEDCILPSKLQAALQQILEEREDILRQENGDRCEGWYNRHHVSNNMLYVSQVFQRPVLLIIKPLELLYQH